MGPDLVELGDLVDLWPLLAVTGGLLVLARVRRLPRDAPATASPVAVVIPARDEADSLPGLLRDLRMSEPPLDLVVVVDDDSQDGTAEVARASSGVVLAASPPLPAGWAGKPWACAHGAAIAAQRLGPDATLVFLDADVRLEPRAVDELVRARHRDGGVVSVQPHHEVRTWWEHASAFCNLVSVLGVGARSARPAGMFGPVVCCTWREYDAVGGHAAVGGAVAEDVELARRFTDRGVPVRLFVGAPFSFRMYPAGPGSLAEGWTKNLATGAATVPVWRSLLVGAWITSLVVVAHRAIDAGASGSGRVVADLVVYAATATAVAVMLRRVGSFRVATAVLYPIPLAVFCGLFARSLVHTFVLGRVNWKGREVAVGRRALVGPLRGSRA